MFEYKLLHLIVVFYKRKKNYLGKKYLRQVMFYIYFLYGVPGNKEFVNSMFIAVAQTPLPKHNLHRKHW